MHRGLLLRGSRFATAYYVIQGQFPGPTVMINAGTHGNEPAGIEAARALRHTRLTKGKLVILPTLNVRAFRKHIRGTPDINRAFPSTMGGTSRHPLAAAVLRLAMKQRPRWVIDMHEATGYSAINRSRLGQSILTSPRSKAYTTARALIARINRSIGPKNHRFTHRMMERPGSLRTALSRLGIRSMTVETSINIPRIWRVHYHAEIVRLLMRQTGLIGPRKEA
ncbi:MAG: succinylglutamate desuccinylase/aspartoacylase family protein [Bacillota bacterium]